MNMKKLLLAAVALSLALCGCSLAGGQVNTQVTPAPVSEATAAPTEAPTPEPTPVPDERLPIGQTATMGDLEVTVTGYSSPEEVKDSMGFQSYTPSDGNVFCLVSLSVKNNGKTSKTFISEYTFQKTNWPTLVYGDGYTYNASHGTVGPKDIVGESVAPLSTITGDVLFSVPPQVVSGDQPLTFNISGEDGSASFALVQ
jgi:hypothetical protein